MDKSTVVLTTSAVQVILRQIITKALVAGGVWLVAQGVLTQDSVDNAVPVVAQEIAGIVLAIAGAGYATWKAKQKNDKAVLAAVSQPGDGTTVVVDGEVVNNA